MNLGLRNKFDAMNASRDRVGIEFISVFGLPPVEFVALAAELGCRQIGMH
jgi:hypothetical protein